MSKPREFSSCSCGASIDLASGESCQDCTTAKYTEVWSHRVSPEFRDFKALMFGVVLLLVSCVPAFAVDTYINPEKLCDAIYVAEGGAKTRHPYGIMKKYKTTTPRQACINTVNSAFKRYKKDDKGLDFVSFLGATYAPIGADNDPTGLNKNWVGNVSEVFYG